MRHPLHHSTSLTAVGLAAAGLAAIAPWSAAAQASAPAPEPRFPPVTARNLEERSFQLPGDLEGTLNVVLVGFAQEQQADMDTWLPKLRALAAAVPALRVYEMPVAPRSAAVMRWMIDGGMRRNIPDRAAREATITLYVDKAAFRTSLGLPDESRIYVLLVDRAGTVRWRAAGPYTAAGFAALERAVGR